MSRKVFASLCTVYAAAEVQQDPDLRAKLAHAMVRVAADMIRVAVDVDLPGGVGVTPNIGASTPTGDAMNQKEALEDLLVGKQGDPAVAAALGLPAAFASVQTHLENLQGAIPEDSEDEALASQYNLLKTAIGQILTQVNTFATWSQSLSEMTTVEPEVSAPKFPTMPRSVKPSVSPEVDKLPVIDKSGADEEPEDEDVGSELEQALAELEGE